MAELVGDFRPAATIWRRLTGDVEIYIIQAEGGELTKSDVEVSATYLLERFMKSSHFATLYDLTDGIKGVFSNAAALISFAADVRKTCAGKQVCSVIVCPNQMFRDWVRWILDSLPKGIPTYIVKDVDTAWEILSRGSFQDVINDEFGDAPYEKEAPPPGCEVFAS